MTEQEIFDEILKCRQFILIHNRIFHIDRYRVCSDAAYDDMSYKLKNLQLKYPDISKKVAYNDVFRDWGKIKRPLPLNDSWVVRKAIFVCANCTKTQRTDVEKDTNIVKPTIKKGALF